VAVHMPDIGSNSNSDVLSSNTAPKESFTSDSFLALLAQATDNSQTPASLLKPQSSLHETTESLETNTRAKAAIRSSGKLSVQHMPAKSEAKPVPAKADKANVSSFISSGIVIAPEATVKASLPVSVSIPVAIYTPVAAGVAGPGATFVSPLGTAIAGMTLASTSEVLATPGFASGAISQKLLETAHQGVSNSAPIASPKGTVSAAHPNAPASTVTEDADRPDTQTSTEGTTSSDKIIPVFIAGDQAQDSTQSTAVVPAIEEYMNSLTGTDTTYQQNAKVTEVVTKTDGATTVRHSDPELTSEPQGRQESKSLAAGLSTDASQPQQHLTSAKEATKSDYRPAAHSTIGSDRPTQASSGNTSSHGGKREDSDATQTTGLDMKAGLQTNGSPTSETRTTFSDAMASKVVGTIPGKEATAPLVQTPFSGPAETGRSQASKTDTSYPDQSSAVAAPLGTIHSAKLVEQAAQSELRVGFHAGEFGNVDIRTSMIHSQLTAEISVEHGELRNLLAVELPHLQTKLAEHSFTAANIALSTHTGGGSSNSRQAYQQNGQGSQSVNARLAEHSTPGVTALEDSQVPMTQLDVHM